MTNLVPQRQLPLLTPAEAFGPDAERFKNSSQTLVSWRDKQSQRWYLNGHLKTSLQRPFGFQITFYDHRTQNDYFGALPARWFTARTFAAHFALTDPKNGEQEKTFRFWQRGGLLTQSSGFAADDQFHVEIGGWYAYQTATNSIMLYANGDGDSLHLELQPTKQPAFHGGSGYVQHDYESSNASYYCSYTHMKASGRLIIDGRLEQVKGTAWFDHEKLTSDRSYFLDKWDRITLQFDTGEELLVFITKASFGSWIDRDGSARHIVRDDIHIENTEYWISPVTKVRYPIKRRLSIPSINLELDLRAQIPAQELNASRTVFSAYWNGEIGASGLLRSAPISGNGYMELVGYDSRTRTKMLESLVKK